MHRSGLPAIAVAAICIALTGLAGPSPAAPKVVAGVVFEDLDGDGQREAGEPGVAGVRVSNGRDWTRTDAGGQYSIAARDDMNLTLVQPAGWRVPVDARGVPQFFHVHKTGGSPKPLRFGGLAAAGEVPDSVDFALERRDTAEAGFRCAVIGDSQAYSGREVGWFRDGVVADLVAAGLGPDDCVLYLGDVVGDDLGLLDRLLETGALIGAPQWAVHGNHDLDFDAASDADSADSWRRLYGPGYYAFEHGQVLFVVLDNVVYPCHADPASTAHGFCRDAESPTYNGRVPEAQMTWLEGLLDDTPKDRLIVLAHHIPLVSFVDFDSAKHQTDNGGQLHALLEGRPALSLSGHTHTIENHAPGQAFEGWQAHAGIAALPFRHLVVGAASGAWYQGDLDRGGRPMALQRLGAPPGTLMLEFSGTEYRERYVGAGLDAARGQWLALNTPKFRAWFEDLVAWRRRADKARHPLPPWSINDLGDPNLITPEDLAEGVWLTANVWIGSAETRVHARLSDGRELVLERTQTGTGEAPRTGAPWADPFAARRQLSVARIALQSRLGSARAQGFELFDGERYGPAPPQPHGALAERNMHLWTARLPEDLAPGAWHAEVTSRDRNGIVYRDTLLFEIRRPRPPPYFRHEGRGE